MKNVIIATLFTALLCSTGINYAFYTCKLGVPTPEVTAQPLQVDYVTRLEASNTKHVKGK
jgi:hypothetical protein